jgi:hypothetical protein
MTENPTTENPTNENLLTKIQREMHERLRELRGAVDEHDRLTAELRALQDIPEPPAALEPIVDPEPTVSPESPAPLEPIIALEPIVDLESAAAAPELPVASESNVAAEPPAALDIAPGLSGALDIAPGQLAAVDIAPGLSGVVDIATGQPAALDVASEPPVAPGPPTNVVRLPARRPLSRTRTVSPKVARLMRVPRRPALERSGVVRVGTVHGGSSPVDDPWPQQTNAEIDVEAEVYERSL